MTLKSFESIEAELAKKLAGEDVSKREGPGGKGLSYLDSAQVIMELNRVFGPLGWSKRVVSIAYESFESDKIDKTSGAVEKAGWDGWAVATIRLELHPFNSPVVIAAHEDVGAALPNGLGRSKGDVLEFVTKSAVTDGLKRCAVELGARLGLALRLIDTKTGSGQAARDEGLLDGHLPTENKPRTAPPGAPMSGAGQAAPAGPPAGAGATRSSQPAPAAASSTSAASAPSSAPAAGAAPPPATSSSSSAPPASSPPSAQTAAPHVSGAPTDRPFVGATDGVKVELPAANDVVGWARHLAERKLEPVVVSFMKDHQRRDTVPEGFRGALPPDPNTVALLEACGWKPDMKPSAQALVALGTGDAVPVQVIRDLWGTASGLAGDLEVPALCQQLGVELKPGAKVTGYQARLLAASAAVRTV